MAITPYRQLENWCRVQVIASCRLCTVPLLTYNRTCISTFPSHQRCLFHRQINHLPDRSRRPSQRYSRSAPPLAGHRRYPSRCRLQQHNPLRTGCRRWCTLPATFATRRRLSPPLRFPPLLAAPELHFPRRVCGSQSTDCHYGENRLQLHAVLQSGRIAGPARSELHYCAEHERTGYQHFFPT
jgi:hypothetical protein